MSEQEFEEEEEENPKPTKRSRKSKGREETPPPAKEESPEPAMPTAEEVCEQWGLNDVDLDYTEADFQNLTTFKLFQQTYRPRIQGENPKVPMSKLMMLVAAKWREFTSMSKGDEAGEEQEEEEPAEEEDEEEVPLSNRGRKSNRGRGGRKSKKFEEEEEEEFEEEEEEDSDDGGKRRGRGKGKSKGKGKKGSKAPVPKLTIKLGRKKKGGYDSDEEKKGDSDEEFENMLAEAEDAMDPNDAQVVAEARKEKKEKLGKPKVKIGNKNKKKGKKKKDFANDETEHQEYCEVCKQGGEIILCDTCPRAYHLVCLEPELTEAPEGKWSCPVCEKEGPSIVEEEEDDEHMDTCRVCKEGGELLCCDSCPSAYHLR